MKTLKLTDALGATYTKTDKDGVYKQGMGVSSDLFILGNTLDDMCLDRAIRYCKKMSNGICYEILHEDDSENK